MWLLLVLLLLCVACGGGGEEVAGGDDGVVGGETLLDGGERAFVVVGESASYAWPAMLQEMLDDHAGGERVYHVLNAAVGGAPVSRWIGEPGPADHDETFGAMERDYFGAGARLRGDAPEPSVALCQPSLQHTRTRRGPIASADDAEGIRIGADALEKLAVQLRDLGVERTYVATNIYREPGEPEVGNERLALEALLGRGHEFVLAGPDVWTATRDAHPGAYAEDGVHPGELGMKIMAEAWYRTVAGGEAREEIVERMYARRYDIESIMKDHLNRRRQG